MRIDRLHTLLAFHKQRKELHPSCSSTVFSSLSEGRKPILEASASPLMILCSYNTKDLGRGRECVHMCEKFCPSSSDNSQHEMWELLTVSRTALVLALPMQEVGH